MGDLSEKSVDHLFGLFRTSGRARYLAEVFDRTAPELLRLASHLARDPAQAEDLVQSTFVEAIRSARRYTPGRSVLPWLNGILANVARETRRREARRPEDVLEPRAGPEDPAQIVAGTELGCAVDDQIDGMDEPYRTVLLLHLRHGLTPGEIARLVGRSPATVRSQLARGRDQLRDRLPSALGGLALLPFSSGNGLRHVRRLVLRRARLAAPALLAATAGSFLTAHKAAGLAASLVLLGTLALLREPGRSSPDRASPLPSAQQAPADVARVARTRPDPRARVAVAGPRPAPEGRASLTVRVTHSGAPLAGVGVRLRPLDGTDPLLSQRHGRTDERGEATFAGLVPRRAQVELDRARGPTLDLHAGSRRTVEVDLSSFADVTGSVLDAERRPLPAASIWLARGGLSELGMVAAQTDRAGRFALRGVDPATLVAAFAPGHAPCAARRLTGGELELVLSAPGTAVTGRVLDEDGRPIAGARVRFGFDARPFYLLEPEGGPMRLVTNPTVVDARTDADGRYSIPHAPAGEVSGFARASGYTGQRVQVLLGRDGVTRQDFVLARGGGIVGTVTDDGAPGAGRLLRAGTVELGAPTWFNATARTAEDGSYRLSGLPPGEVRVELFSGPGGSFVERLRVGEGDETRWDVDLARALAVEGVVLDPAGGPRPGLDVQLGTGGLQRAPTDAAGRFRFLVPRDRGHELAVHDPRALVPVAVARRTDLRAGDGEAVLVVDDDALASAFLTGLVQAEDGGPLADAVLRVRAVEHNEWVEVELDPGRGVFRAGPLVPGTYELRATGARWASATSGPVPVLAHERRDVGPLLLVQGGRLAWDVRLAAGMVEDAVSIAVVDDDGVETCRRDLVGTSGTTPWLPPGPVRFTVWSPRLPILTRRAEVVLGETTPLVLPLEAALPQRLVLEGVSPEPGAGRLAARVTWTDAEGARAHDDHLFPDAQELVLERPLLPGRYEVHVRTDSGRSGRATLEVEPGATHTVRVVLED